MWRYWPASSVKSTEALWTSFEGRAWIEASYKFVADAAFTVSFSYQPPASAAGPGPNTNWFYLGDTAEDGLWGSTQATGLSPVFGPGIYTLNWYQSVMVRSNSSFFLSHDRAGGTVDFEISEAAAVPEPATWATMLMGFGGVGGALRTRKRTATAI